MDRRNLFLKVPNLPKGSKITFTELEKDPTMITKKNFCGLHTDRIIAIFE